MSWDSLGMYALVSGICWVIGAYGAFRNHQKVAVGVTGLGSLVFFLPFRYWLDTLYKMQIQVDIEFQYLDVVGLCLYQCIETGNS